MLDVAVQFLKDELNTFLLARTGSNSAEVVNLSKVVDDAGKYFNVKIVRELAWRGGGGMPKTLFRSAEINAVLASCGQGCGSAGYRWAEGLNIISLAGHTVIVNPSNGGWVAYSAEEFSRVSLGGDAPRGAEGWLLHEAGICQHNGALKQFEVSTGFQEQMYLFEFAVTTGCNLGCIYCFANAGKPSRSTMASKEMAELFIDRIAEYRANTKTAFPFLIEFTGGEPLLNFPVIRHTVEYAQRTYGGLLNAEFIIQSNVARDISASTIDFFAENGIGFGVSCDGFGQIHDRQRPFINGGGSHEQVVTNIRKLRRRYPGNCGAVIAVVTPDGVHQMREIALYLFLMGFQEAVIRPREAIGRGKSTAHGMAGSDFAFDYSAGLFDILTDVITPLYREKGVMFSERYVALTFEHLFRPARDFMCERSPCGAGKNICVTQPNGNVYACNQSSESQIFYLGNIASASFQSIVAGEPARRLSRRTVDILNECASCIFRSWCQSPCPLAAHEKHGEIMLKTPDCEIFRTRYKLALEGLLRGEFDLEVVARLAGHPPEMTWCEI